MFEGKFWNNIFWYPGMKMNHVFSYIFLFLLSFVQSIFSLKTFTF